MRTLFLDCIYGASGDMLISSLLCHLDDAEQFKQAISAISCYSDCEIVIADSKRNGISGKTFHVMAKSDLQLRTLNDIIKIVKASSLTQEMCNQAINAFTALAVAEAKVHGVAVEEIHFHEVGAVDTIFDVMGYFLLLDILKIDSVVNTSINVGSGIVHCAHGELTVPAPAVCELLKGRQVFANGEAGERTTPTGALLLKQSSTDVPFVPEGKICSTGYGIGDREFPDGNYLKSMIIDTDDQRYDQVYLLECNIDDMTGEALGYTTEVLLKSGALDVWQQPIYMKKNRLGTKLSVLCTNEEKFADLIFKHTTTLGIRTGAIQRRLRGESTYSKKNGISIKTTGSIGKPEFEDVKRKAEEQGTSILDIYNNLEEHNE